MNWLLLASLFVAQAAAVDSGNGAVAGEIRFAGGAVAAGVRVSVTPVPDSDPATNKIDVLVRITETDDSGRYRLTNIPAGRYFIIAGTLAAPTYFPGTRSAAGARILTIDSTSNIDGVDFEIPQTSSAPAAPAAPPGSRGVNLISGKVVGEDGRPLSISVPRLYVFVENGTNRTTFGEDGRRIRGSGTFGAVPVSKDGTFTLSLRDGEYPISLITGLGDPVSPSNGYGYYVKSISFGSADLLKEKLRVKGSNTSTITITLARK